MSETATSTSSSSADRAQPAPRVPISGVPIAVLSSGFTVMMLSLSNTGILDPSASLFTVVALATGALGMLIGAFWEFHNGDLMGATFAAAYACFFFTAAVILRWFAPEISEASSPGAFGDAFGVWLLLWGVITGLFAVGAYYIHLPALLAFSLLALVYIGSGLVSVIEPESSALAKITGWVGIVDALCMWWVAMGTVLNTMTPTPRIPMVPYPYGGGR